MPNPRGRLVFASPGEGGISVTNMALGGIFRLALNLFLSHELSEDRIHSELHVAKVFERAEGVLVTDQRALALGDGGLGLVQKGRESVGGIELLHVRQGGGHGSDGRNEPLAERIEIGLRGEDCIRLRIGHGQCTLGGIQRGCCAGGVGVEMRAGRLQRSASGLQQLFRALRIVLEGSEHGLGVEARDAGEFFLRALQIGELLDETFASVGKLRGKR